MIELYILHVVGEDLFIDMHGNEVTGEAAQPMSEIDVLCARTEQKVFHHRETEIFPINGGKCYVESTGNFPYEISISG
ncbi:hypothetical protein CL632_01160 [bacterium]|jgi:hypothetical protein|nr:hypothetical protein [bacterium]MDP6571271.1 hypothetical protein [Patescibacteria group bacterium]MDP6756259.1 hypothetical protein [Patescibacteria group bacterium]|tara:strand:+ start:8419 stop:8652 length:234 start_codon:yes stop_codon:yes gene_type:complete